MRIQSGIGKLVTGSLLVSVAPTLKLKCSTPIFMAIEKRDHGASLAGVNIAASKVVPISGDFQTNKRIGLLKELSREEGNHKCSVRGKN